MAIIFIPLTEKWVEKTKRNLDEREEILKFIANQTKIDQCPNSDYDIKENSIEFFRTDTN